MSIDAATEKNSVVLTDAAAQRIKKILSTEPAKIAMRIAVDGGGCSGFSYRFELVDAQNDDDHVFENDGAKLLVDDISLFYMGHSIVDFVDNLMGQSFQVNNPNAVASCGCGTSFTI